MKRIKGFLLLLLLGLVVSLGRIPTAEAGIFNASEEVTYKEYWIPHNQFTGGCTEDGQPTSPGGSWYSEPDTLNKCPKEMFLTIPDNLANATKAEIYVDLWRNYDTNSARLRINDLPTVYQAPRGYDWSRTPWVGQIPLNSLLQGTNKFLFWGESGRYHIHDVAIRVYYDEATPLVSAGDVTPPDGQLLSITSFDDNVEVDANTGGQLMVNDDKLTFKASVEPGAKLIEFHAFYYGYDDDNDGVWHDWHNVGRNNFFPGGQGSAADKLLGGTINHIGTKTVPPGGGQVTMTWDLPHIVNQSGVRFKIRLIDEAGNVRDAAGGATPEYTLARNYPVVAYTMPDFDDFGIHMDGTRAQSVTYNFPLPGDLDMNLYEKGYLLGMYWRWPRFSLNGSTPAPPRDVGVSPDWTLGVRTLSKSMIKAGNNVIEYSYSGSGPGHFVEHPGPMIVLRGLKSVTPDVQWPVVVQRSPAPSSTNVDVFAPVSVRLTDVGGGIAFNSIIMSVNNQLVQPVLTGASNNLTVTYYHQTPFPPLTNIPVTIYACDLFNNCMVTADQFSFTTEPPDETAPVISNVNALTTESTATITWLTDEGADSLVEYGLTPAYGLPSVSDSALVTQHSIQLTGLTPETTYNFRVSSVDYSGNKSVTTNLLFTTKRVPGAIVSDDFSDCTLDTSVWSFINPKSDALLNLTGNGAQISVPAGLSHDLWRSGQLAPRLMQYVTNQENFVVEAKFDTPVSQRTQSMGVLAHQDNGNWLRFNFQNDGVGNDGAPLNNLVVANSNKGSVNVVFSTPVTMGNNAYMRITRLGTIWNLEYSMDGTNWSFGTTLTRTLNLTQIGPYAGNAGPNPAFTAVIDYFENKADPLAGEDTPLQLNVTKVGVGTVTRTPEKASYLCGETVSVTASTPDPDWTFAGWSGAINSTNATESITLNKTENVTATFLNDNQYLLNVNVVSQGNGVGGTVEKDPDQGSYLYGTPVQLAAKPTPGWSFLGWSGDWVSTDMTTTVPIAGNMNITATFDEDEYTIQTLILTDGFGEGGSIDVDPLKPTYLYGEEVTLTVNVNPGWSFDGWEGTGVSGTESVVKLSMSQDVLAVARLVQNKYDVTVNIINNGDTPEPDNVVLRDPEQDNYGHGQAITLTAVADQGWTFTGWGGALSGTEPVQNLVVEENKAIDATFTQQQYALTVTVSNPAHGSVTVEPQKPYYVFGDVIKLTPVPAPGYDFTLWTGDASGTVEPLFIPIDRNMAVEAVFEIDTTPIEILSQKVTVINTVAVVEWTTDVPGTSRVDYGEDEFYEDGSARKEDLVTTHKLTLTNLKSETRYHYQIISEDAFGNPVQSEDLTFFTGTSSGLASDDFSSCELSGLWTFVNPLADTSNYSVNGQQLELFVSAEDNNNIHNIYTNGMDVPRLMQASNDKDFTVEVKFDSVMTAGGVIQGIVIEQDEQNFMRFDTFLRTYADGPAEVVVYAATFKDYVAGNIKNQIKLTGVDGPLWMRVVRTGNDWEQWYSLDGTNWIKSYQFTFQMEVKKVGLFAGNTRYQGVLSSHTAVVDYFFNTAARIDPEDSRYQLSFDYEGSGMVQRNPSKSGYYCGEQVSLTAVPASGWGFVGWGGDISGLNPTQTITVREDMNILARFQQGVVNEGIKLMMPIVIHRP